jgi:hypothetical protein
MEMYHGNDGGLALHEGLCLTDDPDVASDYAIYWAAGTRIHTVHLDLTGLRVVEVDGYDRDANIAPGDAMATPVDGADVLVYEDETVRGQRHTTWRLMTPAALAAVRHVSTTDLGDD